MKQLRSAKSNQRGAVLAIFAIAMLAIIAIAGLALDLSHAYVDKTRMQNILDATAMSGAMTLTLQGNDASAETAAELDAIATFDAAVQSEFSSAGVTPTIEFSRTLDPFVPGSTPAVFVRARVDQYDMPTWLAKVIGKETIRVGGSAVAGPVNSSTCQLSPIIVCGDPADNSCLPTDDTCYGYNVWRQGEGDPEEECSLKLPSPGDQDGVEIGEGCGPQTGGDVGGGSSPIATGNFGLLDLSKMANPASTCTGGGSNFMKCALAKGIDYCPTSGAVETLPGNSVGPVLKAINTVFGRDAASMPRSEYPPDLVTDYDNPSDSADAVVFYEEYKDRLASGDWDEPSDGIPNRRVKPVIIGDCTGEDPDNPFTGKSTIPVLTVGCFYLTSPVDKGGNEQRLLGQFIGECAGNGNLSLTPSAFVQQKIILYKDPDSTDS